MGDDGPTPNGRADGRDDPYHMVESVGQDTEGANLEGHSRSRRQILLGGGAQVVTRDARPPFDLNRGHSDGKVRALLIGPDPHFRCQLSNRCCSSVLRLY